MQLNKLVQGIRRRYSPYTLLYITAILQTATLWLQKFAPHGDDQIRILMVNDLARGNTPGSKFSIIHPFFSAILEKLDSFSPFLHLIAIEKFGALIWLAWTLIIICAFKSIRSPWYIFRLITFSFASIIIAYLVGFNSEAFSALAISGGLALGLHTKHRAMKGLGWFLVVVGAANIPVTIVGLFACLAYISAQKRNLTYFMPALLAMALVILEASIAKGHLSFTKYSVGSEHGNIVLFPWGDVVGFKYPLLFGLLGNLFSFGRGIFVFIPTIVISLRKRRTPVTLWINSLLVFTLPMLILYSCWWAGYGGSAFGPRFFILLCIPGAGACAEYLTFESIKKKSSLSLASTLGVITWSCWLAAVGVAYFISPRVAEMCMRNNYHYEPLCWFTPEYSSAFSPLWEGGSVGWASKLYILVMVTLCFIACLQTIRLLASRLKVRITGLKLA